MELVNSSKFDLHKSEFEKLLNYPCYERVYYYIFKKYSKFTLFPLFFCDRSLSFAYFNDTKTIEPLYDGLTNFINKYFAQQVKIKVDDFNYEIEHMKKEKYLFEVSLHDSYKESKFERNFLIEGINNRDLLVSDLNWNKLCTHMDIDIVKRKVSIQNDDTILVNRIYVNKIENEFHNIVNLKVNDALKYIFFNIYGYTIQDKELYLGNDKVNISVNGFNDFQKNIINSVDKIITPEGLSNEYKNALHMNIRFKIAPIVEFMRLLIKFDELNKILDEDSINKVKLYIQIFDKFLNSILKFAGLLSRKPEKVILDYYIRTFDSIGIIFSEWQEILIKILTSL